MGALLRSGGPIRRRCHAGGGGGLAPPPPWVMVAVGMSVVVAVVVTVVVHVVVVMHVVVAGRGHSGGWVTTHARESDVVLGRWQCTCMLSDMHVLRSVAVVVSDVAT